MRIIYLISCMVIMCCANGFSSTPVQDSVYVKYLEVFNKDKVVVITKNGDVFKGKIIVCENGFRVINRQTDLVKSAEDTTNCIPMDSISVVRIKKHRDTLGWTVLILGGIAILGWTARLIQY